MEIRKAYNQISQKISVTSQKISCYLHALRYELSMLNSTLKFEYLLDMLILMMEVNHCSNTILQLYQSFCTVILSFPWTKMKVRKWIRGFCWWQQFYRCVLTYRFLAPCIEIESKHVEFNIERLPTPNVDLMILLNHCSNNILQV